MLAGNYGSKEQRALDSPPTESANSDRLLAIGRSLTSNLELESLLKEIIGAARDLTGAEYAALGILNSTRDALERFITLGIGPEARAEIGELPRGRGVLGVLIDDPRPLRLQRLSDHPAAFGFPAHHPAMESFLGVPIMIGDIAYGNLYLTNKVGGEFDDRDEDSVVTLAAWAAIAIHNARSIKNDRLRAALDGAENERKRWARELHDETLQSLGAIHVLLASALRRGDQASLESAASDGAEQLRLEISNLRSLITELRPAALDELGLVAALEGLCRRMSSLADVEVELSGDLDGAEDLSRELQVTLYRIVQEAVNNAAKHSSASRVWIEISLDGDSVCASVRDDGIGFDPDAKGDGFGIVGMRERTSLADGELKIASSVPGGTQITATLPINASD